MTHYPARRLRVEQVAAPSDEGWGCEVKIIFGFDSFDEASKFADGIVKQLEGPTLNISFTGERG